MKYITLKNGNRVPAIYIQQIGRNEELYFYGYSLYVVNLNGVEIEKMDCSDLIDKYTIS